MGSLLRVASGVETAEAFNRVHAFNVLRLVFLDKDLAVDTSAFFADGAHLSHLGSFSSHFLGATMDQGLGLMGLLRWAASSLHNYMCHLK